MPLREPTQPSAEQNRQPDQRQVEGDIDLIRRGASYEITGMPAELADELVAEQKGELYPDLATFIKLNKVIACPKEEIDEQSAEILKDAKGAITSFDDGNIYFIDSKGNIATFKIDFNDYQKIKSLQTEAFKYDSKPMWEELEKYGFKRCYDGDRLVAIMNIAVRQYHEKITRQQERDRHERFDF